MLLRIQGLRIDAMQLRARLALASAFGKERERRLKMAEGLADKIERENMGYANPLATLIRAGIAKQRGDAARALTLTEKALKEFEAADMRLFALFTRRRYAQVTNGDVTQYDTQAREQLVAVPAHAARCLAPGFPDG